MIAVSDFGERAADLRRAFDEAFAAAPVTVLEEYENLLSIRVAGDAYALRLRDLSGLVARKEIVALPTQRSDLLGVAGIRGNLVSVYSLAALLGYRADPMPNVWLALSADMEPVGLAFHEFEGFLRARRVDVHKAERGDLTNPHIQEVVRIDNLARPVVDIPSTIEALKVRSGMVGST